MKILHFSDFHLRPNKQGERSMDLFNRMMDKLQEINQEAVLERHHDAVFAKKMNKKLIEGFLIMAICIQILMVFVVFCWRNIRMRCGMILRLLLLMINILVLFFK